MQSKVPFDSTDWRILGELQEDSRLSHAELSRRVHLSPPAVAARVRRLEVAGVIRGYRLELDLATLGLPVLAYVRVRTQPTSRRQLLETVAAAGEVLECHHVTGEDCYVIKVATGSMAGLEQLVALLAVHGSTTTSIVFSSPVPRRSIGIGSRLDGTGDPPIDC